MEAIKKELKAVEMRIEWTEESLNKAVEEFKEAAAKYDAYSIEEFIPGKVAEIAKYRAKLSNLGEQRDMLQFIIGSMQEG